MQNISWLAEGLSTSQVSALLSLTFKCNAKKKKNVEFNRSSVSLKICYARSVVPTWNVQGIHKRMVRFQKNSLLIPHHSFVYALYVESFQHFQASPPVNSPRQPRKYTVCFHNNICLWAWTTYSSFVSFLHVTSHALDVATQLHSAFLSITWFYLWFAVAW